MLYNRVVALLATDQNARYEACRRMITEQTLEEVLWLFGSLGGALDNQQSNGERRGRRGKGGRK